LNLYAPAINLAGRQRMLSQNIAKQALAMTLRADSPDAVLRHVLLTQLVDEWTAAHESLLAGDAALTIEPISDKATRAALRRLEPSMAAIEQAAGVLAAPNASLSESRQALATILTEEPRYLEGMERAVQLLESAAR